MFDVIIRNGSIIDGSGDKEYISDIGVIGSKIIKIGDLSKESTNIDIDASGKKVSPGFFDIHNHSDTTILAGPMQDSMFMQGVTTLLGGQCGYSPAPVKNLTNLKNITDWLPEWNIPLTWNSFGEYLTAVEKSKPGVNFGCLVGHGALRTDVMGFENRECTETELEEMKVVLKKSLDEGALGFSTGLEYMPGQDASREEIVELCKIVGKEGKLYATHLRNREAKFKEAVIEAIETADKAKVKLQMSHVAPRYWRNGVDIPMLKEQIEDAKAKGVDVACDFITLNFSTFYVMSFLPPWAFNDGIDKLSEYLSDPESRKKMKEFDNHLLGHIVKTKSWDKVALSGCTKNKNLIGKTFTEIGKELNCDPQDAILDIIRAEGKDYLNVAGQAEVTDDNDLAELIKLDYAYPESDIWGVSKFDQLKGNVMSGPAGYSWVLRYLEHFIRDKKIIPLELAIQKLTSLPAKRMNLSDRGLLKEGMYADIVIFDYLNLKGNSTKKNPNQYPSGIEHVFINGIHASNGGVPTGNRSGMVLRG